MRQDSARNAELLQARLVWTWESLSNALRAAGKEIEAGLKTAGEEIDKAFRELRDPHRREVLLRVWSGDTGDHLATPPALELQRAYEKPNSTPLHPLAPLAKQFRADGSRRQERFRHVADPLFRCTSS